MTGSDYSLSIYEKFIKALEEYTHLDRDTIISKGKHEPTASWEASFTEEVTSNPDKLRQHYEGSDLFMFRNPEYYKDREEDGFKYFLDALENMPKDIRILDYGCGAGTFGEVLLRHGFKNVEMVDVKCPTTEFAKWFFEGRAKVYDDPDNIEGKYDVICSNSVFEHLWNPLDTAKYLQSHLNPGGKLIISMAINIGGPHLERAIKMFDETKAYVESNGGLMRS